MPMQPSTKRRQRRSVTLGKGTGYSTKTQPVSAKPSSAGKVRSALKTTSSGITQRPDGRAQSEGRSARQSTSNARVTTGSNGKPSGSGTARVTTGAGKSGGASFKGAAKAVAKRVPHVAAAAEGLQSKNTADGTLKGKPTGPKKGPNPTPGKTKSEQFDNAFRAARKAGQKTFSWNGKRYTTDMK
jgi:hypothetical protein